MKCLREMFTKRTPPVNPEGQGQGGNLLCMLGLHIWDRFPDGGEKHLGEVDSSHNVEG